MTDSTDAFIARWQGRVGGQERANYALILSELCDVLGVKRPDPASASTEVNEALMIIAVDDGFCLGVLHSAVVLAWFAGNSSTL